MIPEFRDDGWLPEGRWESNWEDIRERLGGAQGSVRRRVFSGLIAWRDAAREAGFVGQIILDGSFVSAKQEPGDFDLVFLYDEATEQLVRDTPELRMLLNQPYCRMRFRGDVWEVAPSLPDWLRGDDMFDRTRTGVRKGVLVLTL
jgi:hypothetical protein